MPPIMYYFFFKVFYICIFFLLLYFSEKFIRKLKIVFLKTTKKKSCILFITSRLNVAPEGDMIKK